MVPEKIRIRLVGKKNEKIYKKIKIIWKENHKHYYF